MIIIEPASKDIKTIIKAFKKTEKYSQSFLKSLEQGLQRSNYFTRHEQNKNIHRNATMGEFKKVPSPLLTPASSAGQALPSPRRGEG